MTKPTYIEVICGSKFTLLVMKKHNNYHYTCILDIVLYCANGASIFALYGTVGTLTLSSHLAGSFIPYFTCFAYNRMEIFLLFSSISCRNNYVSLTLKKCPDPIYSLSQVLLSRNRTYLFLQSKGFFISRTFQVPIFKKGFLP